MHGRNGDLAAVEGTVAQVAAPDGRLTGFNLVEYARKLRYRLRNLNDGGPCPPAIWKRPKSYEPTGEAERCYAIVGHSGYIADDGEPGQLGIALFYKSAKGVNAAKAKIRAMNGTVKQEGDTEVAGTVPVASIDEALRLIRVSKVPLRNPQGNPESLPGRFQNADTTQN